MVRPWHIVAHGMHEFQEGRLSDRLWLKVIPAGTVARTNASISSFSRSLSFCWQQCFQSSCLAAWSHLLFHSPYHSPLTGPLSPTWRVIRLLVRRTESSKLRCPTAFSHSAGSCRISAYTLGLRLTELCWLGLCGSYLQSRPLSWVCGLSPPFLWSFMYMKSPASLWGLNL